MEILDGKLTDETTAAINSLKRKEICHTTEDIVGFIQGTLNPAQDRDWLIRSLISDIAFLAQEKLDEPNKEKMP